MTHDQREEELIRQLVDRLNTNMDIVIREIGDIKGDVRVIKETTAQHTVKINRIEEDRCFGCEPSQRIQQHIRDHEVEAERAEGARKKFSFRWAIAVGAVGLVFTAANFWLSTGYKENTIKQLEREVDELKHIINP